MEQAELTQQQRKVLAYVERFSRENGYPPTLREIGEGVDIANVNAVRGHVTALERKGYITRTPEKARSIRVVDGPGGLSRLKRRVHKVLRTDEGVLHRVVYSLAWATWCRRSYWTGRRRQWLLAAFEREFLDRGWEVESLRIASDHVAVTLAVWPNHSPEQVVRRLRSAARSVKRRHMREFPRGRLWEKGYAVTTDPALLDDMLDELLQEAARHDESAGEEPLPASESAPMES